MTQSPIIEKKKEPNVKKKGKQNGKGNRIKNNANTARAAAANAKVKEQTT